MTKEIAKQAATGLMPFALKFALVGGTLVLAYYLLTNRFVKWKESSDFPSSNITQAQAQARANSIIGSQSFFTTDFETVREALSGLNYNGFVRVYNSFGLQSGTLLAGKLNLIEWLSNQFSDYQLQQLSFVTNGAFFRVRTDEQ